MQTYTVRFDHKLGQATSYRMSATQAFKMANDWVAAGETGVIIEDPETGEVWTPDRFRSVAC